MLMKEASKQIKNTTITIKINFKIMYGNVDCLIQVFGWVNNETGKKKTDLD